MYIYIHCCILYYIISYHIISYHITCVAASQLTASSRQEPRGHVDDLNSSPGMGGPSSKLCLLCSL